jgi:hypothetical protein
MHGSAANPDACAACHLPATQPTQTDCQQIGSACRAQHVHVTICACCLQLTTPAESQKHRQPHHAGVHDSAALSATGWLLVARIAVGSSSSMLAAGMSAAAAAAAAPGWPRHQYQQQQQKQGTPQRLQTVLAPCLPVPFPPQRPSCAYICHVWQHACVNSSTLDAC